MANKSIAELGREIAAVEARLQQERREMKAALRSTPGLVKSTLGSGKGMGVAFLAAVIAGVVLAMRRGPAPRSRTA